MEWNTKQVETKCAGEYRAVIDPWDNERYTVTIENRAKGEKITSIPMHLESAKRHADIMLCALHGESPAAKRGRKSGKEKAA